MGGIKKQRVYGLGSHASFFYSHSSTSSSSETSRFPDQSDIDARVQAQLDQRLKEMQEQVQQQLQQQLLLQQQQQEQQLERRLNELLQARLSVLVGGLPIPPSDIPNVSPPARDRDDSADDGSW